MYLVAVDRVRKYNLFCRNLWYLRHMRNYCFFFIQGNADIWYNFLQSRAILYNRTPLYWKLTRWGLLLSCSPRQARKCSVRCGWTWEDWLFPGQPPTSCDLSSERRRRGWRLEQLQLQRLSRHHHSWPAARFNHQIAEIKWMKSKLDADWSTNRTGSFRWRGQVLLEVQFELEESLPGRLRTAQKNKVKIWRNHDDLEGGSPPVRIGKNLHQNSRTFDILALICKKYRNINAIWKGSDVTRSKESDHPPSSAISMSWILFWRGSMYFCNDLSFSANISSLGCWCCCCCWYCCCCCKCCWWWCSCAWWCASGGVGTIAPEVRANLSSYSIIQYRVSIFGFSNKPGPWGVFKVTWLGEGTGCRDIGTEGGPKPERKKREVGTGWEGQGQIRSTKVPAPAGEAPGIIGEETILKDDIQYS